MNFDHNASPYNMPELTFRYGYPFALALMLLSALGLLWYYRRKGWLGAGAELEKPEAEPPSKP
jgi:magnesium transporter